MNLNIRGLLTIHAKDTTGRICPPVKHNTIVYGARNVLIDLIAGTVFSQDVNRGRLVNRLVTAPEDTRNDTTLEAADYVDFCTPANAILTLDTPSQVVDGTHTITNTITPTYSGNIDPPTGHGDIEYSSQIPAGTLNVSLTPGGDPDPDVDKNYLGGIFMDADTRHFSYVILPTPILLDPTYTYTITYTYRIN